MHRILAAREERAKHIKKLIDEHRGQTIVILKSNVVGDNKNPQYMKFVCTYFFDVILETFRGHIKGTGKRKSDDGEYCYFIIDESGTMVKERTISIEETSPLGRLIDLDVYAGKSISRHDLQCEMRRCLICDQYAHICVRNKTHTEAEIEAKIKSIIHAFLVDYITNSTTKAIFSELELYPKAGLVSHRDSGCHTDMDYEVFVRSTFAIKHDIEDYILEGTKENIDPERLVAIGKRAEQHMFTATEGINTHKGLIFLLGFFLPAITKAIINNDDEAMVIQTIQSLATSIVGSYYEELTKAQTHGDAIYLNHGIKGARQEVLDGLQRIFSIPSVVHHDDDVVHHEYFIRLLADLDDTTIIHKTDLTTLRQVQSDMKQIVENGGYINNKEPFHTLSNNYKKAGISPGGSADMLVLKIIYEDVKHLMRQMKEEAQ